jgi:hypothetical protein
MESQTHLRDGLDQKHISRQNFHDLWLLAKRAQSATIGLKLRARAIR